LNRIRKCLPLPQKTYILTKRLKTLEEVEKYFPSLMAFVDFTEQQIPRPDDNKRKKIFYLGKKKRHGIKNQMMVNNHRGSLGIEKDYPEQLFLLSYKKRYQLTLSQEEIESNTIHSKMRIVMEHIITRFKKYRIMSEIFRNRLRKYNKMSDIVAGLVNYRIMNQQN
jgi:hypothetical protein